ncbi:MAG: hypothetical protein WCT53_01255 [Candidatus Gracilibacteria bacterium]
MSGLEDQSLQIGEQGATVSPDGPSFPAVSTQTDAAGVVSNPESTYDAVLQRLAIDPSMLDPKETDLGTLNRAIEAAFGRINFVDDVEPEVVAGNFTRREKGFSPVEFPISNQLRALRNPENAAKTVDVHALSVGGTNVLAGRGKYSTTSKLALNEFSSKVLRPANSKEPLRCTTASEYWQKVLPEEFVESLRRAADSGKSPRVSLSLAYPIDAQGCIAHFADKVDCPELAPRGAGVERSSERKISAVASFCEYLGTLGIKISQNEVSICPNDTVATAFAFSQKFAEHDNVGAMIIGTGSNAFVVNGGKGVNTECGHSNCFRATALDEKVCANQPEPFNPSFESMVSGKVMGELFREAVTNVFGESHHAVKWLNAHGDDLLPTIIHLAFNDTSMLHDHDNPNERMGLCFIAHGICDRAAKYAASMLQGLAVAHGEPRTVFFADGSLITKNPKFCELINRHAGRKILVVEDLPVDNKTSGKVNLDASFVGTFAWGGLEELAA